jgi:hypothetical protein
MVEIKNKNICAIKQKTAVKGVLGWVIESCTTREKHGTKPGLSSSIPMTTAFSPNAQEVQEMKKQGIQRNTRIGKTGVY